MTSSNVIKKAGRPKSNKPTGKHVWMPAAHQQRYELLADAIDKVTRYEKAISLLDNPSKALIEFIRNEYNVNVAINNLSLFDNIFGIVYELIVTDNNNGNDKQMPVTELPSTPITPVNILESTHSAENFKGESLQAIANADHGELNSVATEESLIDAEQTKPAFKQVEWEEGISEDVAPVQTVVDFRFDAKGRILPDHYDGKEVARIVINRLYGYADASTDEAKIIIDRAKENLKIVSKSLSAKERISVYRHVYERREDFKPKPKFNTKRAEKAND